MRLIGCIRVSQVRGRAGESFISVDVQRQQIEQYAAVRGHEIIAWQEDLDQPGSTLNRPGMQAALHQIAAGNADGIIAAKLDRITRSIADLGRLLEQARAGNWNLIAVDVGLDLGTPNGRLVAHVLGAVAEWELERRRADWDEARARAVGRGVHIASRAPTGYKRKPDGRLEIDPAAASAIKETFELRAQGLSWKQLAASLTTKGIVGPYGNSTWTEGAVTKLVNNRAYLGEARHGIYVNPDGHEPIVTPNLFDTAKHVIGMPSRRLGETPLLAGLVRCSGCRYVMKSDSMRDGSGTKLRMYRCRGVHAPGKCEKPVAILSRVIEPHIERLVLDWLETSAPAAQATIANADHDAAVHEHTAAEAELLAYIQSEALTIAGPDMFEQGLTARQARLNETQTRLRDSAGRITMIGSLGPRDLNDLWPTLPTNEKNEIIKLITDAIVVWPHRSGRPSTDRFQVYWRGDAPTNLPRRGLRLPLQSWTTDRPSDLRMTATKDPE